MQLRSILNLKIKRERRTFLLLTATILILLALGIPGKFSLFPSKDKIRAPQNAQQIEKLDQHTYRVQNLPFQKGKVPLFAIRLEEHPTIGSIDFSALSELSRYKLYYEGVAITDKDNTNYKILSHKQKKKALPIAAISEHDALFLLRNSKNVSLTKKLSNAELILAASNFSSLSEETSCFEKLQSGALFSICRTNLEPAFAIEYFLKGNKLEVFISSTDSAWWREKGLYQSAIKFLYGVDPSAKKAPQKGRIKITELRASKKPSRLIGHFEVPAFQSPPVELPTSSPTETPVEETPKPSTEPTTTPTIENSQPSVEPTTTPTQAVPSPTVEVPTPTINPPTPVPTPTNNPPTPMPTPSVAQPTQAPTVVPTQDNPIPSSEPTTAPTQAVPNPTVEVPTPTINPPTPVPTPTNNPPTPMPTPSVAQPTTTPTEMPTQSRCASLDCKTENCEYCDESLGICASHCSEGAECCKNSACVPKSECSEAECGNNEVEEGEECDDGNQNTGDGCAPDCKREFCCICRWGTSCNPFDTTALSTYRFCSEFINGSECEGAYISQMFPFDREFENETISWTGESIPSKAKAPRCSGTIDTPDMRVALEACQAANISDIRLREADHSDAQTPIQCLKNYITLCKELGILPPAYLRCSFPGCESLSDMNQVEALLLKIKQDFPFIQDWEITGNQALVCHNAITGGTRGESLETKISIKPSGSIATGLPFCSQVVGQPYPTKILSSNFPKGKCFEDRDTGVCPTSYETEIFACPNNYLTGGKYDAHQTHSATWRDSECPEWEWHEGCLGFFNPSCEMINGPGEWDCSECEE
jgi:cysteine-rich repeat protein